ncbi:hypothetical protein BJX99DRAFT_71563 [Aspergillus californicus]
MDNITEEQDETPDRDAHEDLPELSPALVLKRLATRLNRLSSLANLMGNEPHPKSIDANTTKQCLATLDSLLKDKRGTDVDENMPQLMPRGSDPVAKLLGTQSTTTLDTRASATPVSRTSSTPNTQSSITPQSAPKSHIRSRSDEVVSSTLRRKVPSKLRDIHKSLKTLGNELEKRRIEAYHLHTIVRKDSKAQGEQIAEQETLIQGLQEDMLGVVNDFDQLQTMVQSLEAYLKNWKSQLDPSRHGPSAKTTDKITSWVGKGKKINQQDDINAENLYDGIIAWKNAWEDAVAQYNTKQEERRAKRGKRIERNRSGTISRLLE